MDEFGNVARPDEDRKFLRHQNRWLALSAVAGAVFAAGLVGVLDGHHVIGSIISAFAAAGLWYTDMRIMTAPGTSGRGPSRGLPIVAGLLGIVAVFLGYDIYALHYAAGAPVGPQFISSQVADLTNKLTECKGGVNFQILRADLAERQLAQERVWLSDLRRLLPPATPSEGRAQ